MKKICIISPGHLPVPAIKGGAVENLITYWIEKNEIENLYKIDLFTIYDNNLTQYKYKNTCIKAISINPIKVVVFKAINKIYRLLNINKHLIAYGYEVSKLLNKEQNDYEFIIVENYMPIFNELKKSYNKYKDATIYYHMHNSIYHINHDKYLFDMIAQKCKKIIFVSNYMKSYFNSIRKIDNGVVLYNCIDINKFLYKGEGKKNNKNLHFIFTGRCVKEKGVLELVNAFNQIKSNAKLTVCGMNLSKPSKYEKNIINLSKNNSNIYLKEYMSTDKLKACLEKNDVVVIPSIIDEAFGVVALEAMAMKKGIIATNTGGLVEPLNNECAIIVEKDNLEINLLNAMNSFINDRELLKRMKKNAYNRILNEKRFNSDNYLNELNKIVEK